MIALDTSAIILDAPDAAVCVAVLEASNDIVICAATMAETLIVADSRNVGAQARRLIDGLGLEVASVTRLIACNVRSPTTDRLSAGRRVWRPLTWPGRYRSPPQPPAK